jgi:signal transduction histidine kinase/DNA-binding response OmpR family regulator/HAMP domain-containing protein
VRNIADVSTAIARGDLSRKITVDVRGEILQLKETINTMVDQLNAFAAEVTRVAREVGTEGKLGGQAEVKGVSGTWKDLTDNVNSMAGNLTSQVRGIAKVVTAVANGDLNRKLTLEAKGEIAALADTINGMIETLATFADQVTTVAREVGVQGRLGGQASVPGAAGTWKALTDNVNQLAANLTTQVRAIAEVATAVTKGDLTRFIAVEAQGEVASLKDNINEMIRNLKDTTLKNSEQDWLKTNLAKFSRMLQGQKDLLTVGRLILSELAPVVSAHQAMFYLLDTTPEEPQLVLLASYAYQPPRTVGTTIKLGEGLIGQCAVEREQILLTNVPGDYTHIGSGLGAAPPRSIIVLPVLFEGQVKAVVELASFEQFNPMQQALLEQLTESIGIVLNTIAANMRTEDLLKQSQSLAMELQNRQQELQQTNQELKEKARLLAHQNVEVERKNFEVEQARQALEDKAKQLALTSKYKSEFLANMSHELRTPLNSLLILSDQLSKNPDGNLTPRQTEYAQTIHSSGNDLLTLINDILDLSKIESGTVALDIGEVHFSDLHDLLERTFRHVAEAKGVDFKIQQADDIPPLMQTDTKRLQQVLKNLLSNAFKFTHRGTVSLGVTTARDGWSSDNDSLNAADQVLAFSVADTGIGIPPDKQQSIFEAFQQADGSTSRKYGGTGLGLAISRELARLLGGEIRLASTPGAGSTFTLYLPLSYNAPRPLRRPTTAKPLVTKRPEPIQTIELPLDPEPATTNEFNDDRDLIRSGDQAVLIVENDPTFVQLLLEAAREKGFKGVATSLGAAALSLAREYPVCAATLDICLPDINGWRVLQRLKQDLETRHIPVYVVSTEDDLEHAHVLGAIDTLLKPMQTKESVDELFFQIKQFVDQRYKELLVVEPDADQREHFTKLFGNGKLRSTFVDSGKEALELMEDRRFDCIVYHLRPADTAIDTLVDAIGATESLKNTPLVMSTEASFALDTTMTDRLARGVGIRHVQSPERLLDEVTSLLHLPVAELAEPQQQMLEKIHEDDAVLNGRQVLIVDDDIRNIFALTSVLERYNMRILAAETGRDAIQILQNTRDIDVVLMDIMMPEFDGLDTTRAIREIPQFKELPIIAVTAKAMKGDREKCIEAGAWDYLSKPVNPDQMLSVLRAWIRR